MLTETVLGAITEAVFGYLLEKVDPVELTINWVTRKVGGEPDPKRHAFGQALDRACDQLATKHATWTASLFDGSLFKHEGAPILAQLLMRNGHPQPLALAACWAASLGLPDNEQRRALVAELEPVAAEFLVDLGEALKREPALMEINDSRAFEQMVTELATIRTQLADAEPTVGRDQISAQIDWVNGNIVIGNDNQQVTYNVQTLIVQQERAPEVDFTSTRTTYLNWLIDRNRYLDPRGTQQTTRQVQLKLDEIYISLKAQVEESQSKLDRRLLQSELVHLDAELADLPVVEQEDRRDQLYARLGMQQRETVSTAPVDLATAVAQHDRLVILGDPGSGKTTLLRYLALQSALALIHQEEGRFPILVRIADYAEDGA
ncbi:MAG: hypothetical protein R2932_25700 [Caldilineaceae bacterium]